MAKTVHVDNITVRAMIEQIEKKVWPRGKRAATIGSLRDAISEATITRAWGPMQTADGSMLADYSTPYE